MQSVTIRSTCRSASRSDASCTRGDLASRATEPAARCCRCALLGEVGPPPPLPPPSSSSAIAPPPPAAALPLAPASAPPSAPVAEPSLRWSGESRAPW